MPLTPRQQKWYRAEWAKVRAELQRLGLPHGDAARRQIHEDAGAPPSTKDFTRVDFDFVLAEFWRYTKPASVNSQLRQIEQPRTRLLHRIRDQIKCLALFVEHPEAYALAILRDKFHTAWLEDLSAVARASQPAGPEASSLEEIPDDDLTQMRNTLERCLSRLRHKYNAGDSPNAPLALSPQPLAFLSEHDMCRAAAVPCRRKKCAQCRDAKAAHADQPASPEAPSPAFAESNNPF